ncbi:MAG: hypothetical protein E6K81_10175 [Candidatus Eisenbacteria bacterium]|uniref:DprA winged helix domain-containing protein n=1 Tax=Eiseniibacteriota bacterium TaxID=2212470 RepID=A0A538U686_UNCEI|nr:MAG: hypothetical protein E6K81_10175 [Candidatus Eisenbacteria bacterium]
MAAMVGRYGAARPEPVAPAVASPAATPEARLLAALGDTPRAVERLAAAAGLPVAEALSALLALRWAGAASPRPGQRWVRGTP